MVRAAGANNVALVQKWLDKGADVNAGGATEELSREILRRIASDASGNAQRPSANQGRTALIVASEQGFEDVVQTLLVAGADVSAQANHGESALWLALDRGEDEVVRVLVEHGADINAKGSDGEAPLVFASTKGYRAAAQALVERGADVNSKREDGTTVLMLNSQGGYPEVVWALLDRGADVNAKRRSGGTALMDASYNGFAEIVQVLLDKGADVNAARNDGQTALTLASGAGHRNVEQLLNGVSRGAAGKARAPTKPFERVIPSQFQGTWQLAGGAALNCNLEMESDSRFAVKAKGINYYEGSCRLKYVRTADAGSFSADFECVNEGKNKSKEEIALKLENGMLVHEMHGQKASRNIRCK
jgi:ankyrin repeat protein